MGAGEIAEFRRDMQSAKRELRRGVKESTREAGRTFETTAKRNIIENDAVASTELFRGITSIRDDTLMNGSSVKLLSRAEHSGFVEHGVGDKGDGRYPENPDVSPDRILTWGFQKPSFTFNHNPFAASITIAKNISGEGDGAGGVVPQPFFNDAKERGFIAAKVTAHRTIKDAFRF